MRTALEQCISNLVAEIKSLESQGLDIAAIKGRLGAFTFEELEMIKKFIELEPKKP